MEYHFDFMQYHSPMIFKIRNPNTITNLKYMWLNIDRQKLFYEVPLLANKQIIILNLFGGHYEIGR